MSETLTFSQGAGIAMVAVGRILMSR